MKKTMIAGCLLLLGIVNINASHSGRVFIDSNKNGVYDKGEKPLANVSVSDGLNVVKTGSDGRFTLTGHDRERFIFVTTPAGYRTSDKHYHPINQSTQSYDFGLSVWNTRTNSDGSHRFLHLADTEIFNTIDQAKWANTVRDYAANEGLAFIIHTGDICYESGLKEHIKLMNDENMACPMFYCIGNHDLVKGKYGEELFESIYGPVFYSFDFGNVHYIVTPMAGGDYQPGYTREDVYRWLKNDIAQVPTGKPIIVFNHDLLTTEDQFIFGINDTENINLSNHNLKAWLYGHWHINYMRKQGKTYSISTATLDKGGIDHSTSAYRVVSVAKDGDVKSELRYTYIDNSIEIASIANEGAPIRPNGEIPISINTYNSTSPAKRVSFSYSVDDKTIARDIPLSQNTDWNWSANLKLSPSYEGKYIFVDARVEFNNGNVATRKASFVYNSKPKQQVKTGQDWTNLLQSSKHVGIAKDTLSNKLAINWISNVKANLFFSSPIVFDNTVYVASVDENLKGEGGIHALDAQNGNIRWKYTTRNSIKNSIAYSDGNIYAQDADGYLYAVDAKSGKLSWEKKLNTGGLPALLDGLTTNQGIVYAGSGRGLASFDAKTGNKLWENTGWNRGEGTTSTISVGEKVLVSGAQWKGLFANDVKTGKQLWAHTEHGLTNRGASAAIHGDLLYLISDKSLFIIDINTGSIVTRKPLGMSVDVTSTPLVTDKLIVFGSLTNGLVALNRQTLEKEWNMQTLPALIYTAPYTRHPAATIETSPVLCGSTIYFGASDGILYGVDIKTGRMIWKHTTGASIFSTVAVSGNALFATDFAGNVYGFVSE